MEGSRRVSSAWPPQRINDNNENEDDNDGNEKDHHYQHLQETWKGQERNQAVPLLQERTRYQRQSTMCSTGSGWSSTFEKKDFTHFCLVQMTRKVSGVLMVNQEGLPIKTTMDSSTTAIYGGMVIALFFQYFLDFSRWLPWSYICFFLLLTITCTCRWVGWQILQSLLWGTLSMPCSEYLKFSGTFFLYK